MFEKVNPSHPDKVADRIAGAIVDLAYTKNENPRVACEVLIGHCNCHVIIETSEEITYDEVSKIVDRITGGGFVLDLSVNKQDEHLANNQKDEIRCGDNGIFKGVPVTLEQRELSRIAHNIYEKYPYDGKYILDWHRLNDNYVENLIICQSNAKNEDLRKLFPNADINPLGEWTGGPNVDTGATNRKLGSDLGDAVTGGGTCLSGDSEYLGEDLKWHPIKDYKQGKVGQWNNGYLEFVQPLKFIHNESDDLIYIHNDSKLSMSLTPYHEMLIKTSKGNLIKREAGPIAEKLSKGIGNSGYIIHSFIYSHQPKDSAYLDENDYRLQVAFCADGTLLDLNKWNGRIRVKKEYKKTRLRELLKDKEYLETQDGEYSIFWYNFTKPSKSLYECFKDENWDVLKEEVFAWDGDKNHHIFRTTLKEDADFIQFVLQSYGLTSGITLDDRRGRQKLLEDKSYTTKSILYTVNVYKSTTTLLRKNKSTPIVVEYSDEKQPSYCFNVPSHNLVIRHNNKIFITGNCGKDLSKADVSVNIVAHLLAQMYNCTVVAHCAIGDEFITFFDEWEEKICTQRYEDVVETARAYINQVGGFEKFAEWGLCN